MTESQSDSRIYRFKKITLLGCGQMGSRIAIRMSDAGNIVTVIDKIAGSMINLPEDRVTTNRIIPVVGDGTLESVLRLASTQDADVYIATTEKTSVNLMSALIANYIFQVPEVTCVVHDAGLEEMANKCGISIINPLNLVVDKLSDLSQGT